MLKHKHHILPKHAGGSDDPSNLIEVTVEEHAELHLSLYLEHGMWQDWLAYNGLIGRISTEEATRLAVSYNNSNRSQEEKDRIGNLTKIAMSKDPTISERIAESNRRRKGEKRRCKHQRLTEVTKPDGTTFLAYNLQEVCDKYNLTRSLVHHCCIGLQKHHKGFRFRWINN